MAEELGFCIYFPFWQVGWSGLQANPFPLPPSRPPARPVRTGPGRGTDPAQLPRGTAVHARCHPAHLLGAAAPFLPCRHVPSVPPLPTPSAEARPGLWRGLGVSPCYQDEITRLFALQTLLVETLQEMFPPWQGWCAHKLAFIYVLASCYENLPSGHTYAALYQRQGVNKCQIFAWLNKATRQFPVHLFLCLCSLIFSEPSCISSSTESREERCKYVVR